MFDLIIRNGKELGKDPVDIGVKNGKIALISKHIEETAKQELTLSDEQYLSAGWIDDHFIVLKK